MLVNKVLEVDLSIPNSVKEKFLKKKWLVKNRIGCKFMKGLLLLLSLLSGN